MSENKPVVIAAYLKANHSGMSDKLQVLRLRSPSFSIGRAKLTEVSLCLMDVNISRKHCEFVFSDQEGGWTVTDLSSNGVFINDIRIPKTTPTPLQPGDSIVLSEQKLLYNWIFIHGEPPCSKRSSDAEIPEAKRPRTQGATYDTQKFDEAVNKVKKVAEVRMLREKIRLENAVKVGQQKQEALVAEREMLLSRLEDQVKKQTARDREAREHLIKEMEGKVDRDEILKEFEDRLLKEKQNAEEERQVAIKDMEDKIAIEDKRREEEIQRRDETLLKLNKEKEEMAGKLEREKEEMNQELEKLKIRLEEENVSKESLKKELEDRVSSLTTNMEETLKEEKTSLERAIASEKQQKEALSKEMENMKTMNEFVLETERASHAAAMEMVKEEQEQKDEEIRLKQKEIEERCSKQDEFAKQMKDQLAELEKKKLELEQQIEQVNAMKEAKKNEDLNGDKTESLENEIKVVAESEKLQSNILGRLAESLEREYQCPTCLDVFICPVSLNCGHTYCWLCLAQWKNSSGRTRHDLGTCPECREVVRHENRVIAIDHMIDAIMEQLGEEKKKEREEKVKERKGRFEVLICMNYPEILEDEEAFKSTATVAALATANRAGAPTPPTRGRGGPGARERGRGVVGPPRGRGNQNRGRGGGQPQPRQYYNPSHSNQRGRLVLSRPQQTHNGQRLQTPAPRHPLQSSAHNSLVSQTGQILQTPAPRHPLPSSAHNSLVSQTGQILQTSAPRHPPPSAHNPSVSHPSAGPSSVRSPPEQTGPIQISSESDSASDDEPEEAPYYGGYGRCYRCSKDKMMWNQMFQLNYFSDRRGHWANACPF